MKKTDIKEGVTFQSKGGSAAREVLGLTPDRSEANRNARYKTGEEDDLYVVYEQTRGPMRGTSSAVTITQFARWAHSEDTGTPASTADLRQRCAELEADRKALMAVIQSVHEFLGNAYRTDSDLKNALAVLPDHLKEEAAK